MFYQDFSVGQGVLVIDLHHAMHEAQMRIAPGDLPVPPDPRANPVIMVWPGDGPHPPDPRANPVIMIAPGDGPLPPDPK